jgi:Dna[CI] antecedent, DciA
MERLEADVRRELARFDGLPPAQLMRIVELWPAAVGETIAANAWPARLGRDGTLHVATSSSVWAFELAQLAPQILELLGDDAPRALRFALGHLPEPAAPADPEPLRERLAPAPEDEFAARGLVAEIDDEDLRKIVAKAVALSLARRRYDRRF